MENKTMLKVLDTCYDKAVQGLPTSDSVYIMASKYMRRYRNPRQAAQKMCSAQIAKCGTSGFLSGLGGLLTLPLTVPANVGSVLYVQLRMIAAVAVIGGYDPSDDEVQTLAYACLTGSAAADIIKKAGINLSEKLTVSMIKKIPGAVLTKINQKVGFRLITKFGEKGIVNLGKGVPLVGGVLGGGIDIVGTKGISKVAISMFIDGKIN